MCIFCKATPTLYFRRASSPFPFLLLSSSSFYQPSLYSFRLRRRRRRLCFMLLSQKKNTRKNQQDLQISRSNHSRERNETKNCARIVPLPSLAFNFDAAPLLLFSLFSIIVNKVEVVLFYYVTRFFMKRQKERD